VYRVGEGCIMHLGGREMGAFCIEMGAGGIGRRGECFGFCTWGEGNECILHRNAVGIWRRCE
jgi:hypothetical protein